MERSTNRSSHLRWLLCILWLLAAGKSVPAQNMDLDQARQLFLKGNYQECIKEAEARLAVRQTEPWQLLLTRSLMATGKLPEALRCITNAIARDQWNVRLLWEARGVLQSNGMTEEAEKLTETVIEEVSTRPRDHRDAASLVVFARAALARGADPKRVLTALLEAARKMDPKGREVYLASGEVALDKHDFALAAKHFEAGLKELPDDPDLLYGMACAFSESDLEVMQTSLESALSRNTNHVPSLLLLVDHSIDAEEYAQADKLLNRVQQVNPAHPDAWAYRAVLAHLRNQPNEEKEARANGLKYWRTNPRVDFLIGKKLSQNYRFSEGAAHQRTALKMAANYEPARAQLAQDLLRLGQEEEGWKLARQVHDADGYDVEAFNLVTLHDSLKNFGLVTNEHFQVRMSAEEARIYGARALNLLERARSNLTQKYDIALDRPVLVEIFPEQKDFAVRTFGMPGNPGYLGVCFGNVITANSPASQKEHPVNWEAVLWHEFCHVVTLNLTKNKMPRWLSEGISVYEETRANPAWGQHMNPRYREMILEGELTPMSKLSSAFLSPPSPLHLQFAYFESCLAVEFLTDRYGSDKLKAILRDLGQGEEINKAIEKHTVAMAQLDKDFETFAHNRARQLAPGLDFEKPETASKEEKEEKPLRRQRPRRGSDAPVPDAAEWAQWAESRPTNFWVMMRKADESMESKDWDAAKSVLQKLIELYPGLTGADSAYRRLAYIHRTLGETNAEISVLTEFTRRDAECTDAYGRLMELAKGAGDWATVALNARRYLAVNPLVQLPHRFLAEASDQTGDLPQSIAAYRALLELNPEDPADTHYRLARALFATGDPEAKRQVLEALEEAPRFRAALKLLLEIERKGRESSQAPAADRS